MTTDNKTLADVQPGGRVRLGDQAERARFEAWAGKFWSLEKGWWVGQTRYHSDYAQRTWEAWQAALSAQPSPGETLPPEMRLGSPDYLDYLDTEPSPGGQDGPERCAECRHTTFEVHPDGHICVHCKLIVAARQPVGISADWVLGYLTTDAPEESREAIRNAFAEYADLSGARQPVGEPFGYCADFDPGAHEFSHTFYYLAPGEKVPEGCTPFFTKQPAQAVDLGEFREAVLTARSVYVSNRTMTEDANDPHPERKAQRLRTVHAKIEECDRLLALIDKAVGNK